MASGSKMEVEGIEPKITIPDVTMGRPRIAGKAAPKARSLERINREALQNERAQIPVSEIPKLSADIGNTNEESRERIGEATEEAHKALGKVLGLLPSLSGQGLQVVKLTCENYMIPAGLSVRIGVGQSLEARSGGPAPSLMPKGKGKGKGSSKSKSLSKEDAPEPGKSAWAQADPLKKKELMKNPILLGLNASLGESYANLTQSEKRDFKSCKGDADFEAFLKKVAPERVDLVEKSTKAIALYRSKVHSVQEALVNLSKGGILPSDDDIQKVADSTTVLFFGKAPRSRGLKKKKDPEDPATTSSKRMRPSVSREAERVLDISDDVLTFDPTTHGRDTESVAKFLAKAKEMRGKLRTENFHRASSHGSLEEANQALEAAISAAQDHAHRMAQ